ncbi:competence/damage-inducible protein A [Virgibacillus sp. W0181]|uniref:competence/damage-inducible protein A n=1 Tax=Virgibacillus sp. W0181 TaxID=3391581 RepID=UPI003F48C668
MKQYNTEIIAVGTELLLGQISNTNAQWLSEQLAAYGVNTYYHTVVGDNLSRVEQIFNQAHQRSDIIIVTGGLGPTQDDLTREAFQQLSHMEITEHKPSMDKIIDFYNRQEKEMTLNNRRQARVFVGAKVIPNTVGMAPGMIVTFESKTWIFLPGVPREMKQMTINTALPFISELMGEQMIIKSKVLRFMGIGESQLEHELQTLIQTQDNPTVAPLAQNDGVVIRLTAKASSSEQAETLLNETKQNVLDKVGEYFYGMEHDSIQDTILSMLNKQNKYIGVAESLTGGMFADKLISASGASSACRGAIVCYDTSVKTNVLQVSTNTINSEGTVSSACALEMAANVCQVLDADIGISFTGVAGPGAVEGQPVGTVFIGISSTCGKQKVEKFLFEGDRNTVRRRAMLKGFELLYHFIKV